MYKDKLGQILMEAKAKRAKVSTGGDKGELHKSPVCLRVLTLWKVLSPQAEEHGESLTL